MQLAARFLAECTSGNKRPIMQVYVHCHTHILCIHAMTPVVVVHCISRENIEDKALLFHDQRAPLLIIVASSPCSST